MQKLTFKTFVILIIELIVAVLHIVGPMRETSGIWFDLYYSYFSDLVMPFAFYFLLCLSETNLPILRHWWLKAGLVFGAATSAEILQLIGVYALGVTFDPLDIVMYACGVLSAVLLERGIFARRLVFWTT